MFNRKKVAELECKIKELEDELNYYKKLSDHQGEQLVKMTRKRRCEGRYCNYCENCGPEKVIAMHGCRCYTERTCLLDVPCPDFKHRREEAFDG